MDISNYRRSFAEYNSAIELAHFELRAGFKTKAPLNEILDQYGDLFRLEAVNSLSNAFADSSESLITEKSALHSLCSSARIGYLEFTARDLINERALSDSAAKIKWDGQNIPAHSAPRIVANETNTQKRREIWARTVDALASGNDIRASCFGSYHQSARDLGFESYRALFSDIMGVNIKKLASDVDAFLERSENVYRNGIVRELAAQNVNTAFDDLAYSDFLFMQKMRRLDRYFPDDGLLKLFDSAKRGLGIKNDQDQNIHFDIESRAGKNPRAACFRVDPPSDIRLILSPVGGLNDYRVLFHEAGHAQHFAWSSKELIRQYPEFMFAPENATSEGYAFLLSNLFHDPLWIVENCRGLTDADAQMIARGSALLTLSTVRRYCAKLKYEIELHDSALVTLDQLARSYSELHARITFFKRSPLMYLADVDDGFYAAVYLRAWAFEAALREHLRVRYGRRWWSRRQAGDDLIDLWNTSSRYSVEDLSSLIGFGDLSFDLLAETLIEAAKGD